MLLSESQRHAFRQAAAATSGIDLPAYAASGRDWREPVLGLGAADAPLCIFGRDPGRTEVAQGEPFLGAGGRILRRGLWRHLQGAGAAPEPGPDDLRTVGRHVFWLNTVPYKPIGNKAWSMAVKRRFQPLVHELLLTAWHGRTVLTLGREAFLWFGIGQPKDVQARLDAFWLREDRFAPGAHIDIAVAGDGTERTLTLCPLPHPSPLNAAWFKRFPALLEARLAALEGSPQGLLRSVPAAGTAGMRAA
jgi:uracil-DNA glycosylase